MSITKNYLVSGYPACGKTHFGNSLVEFGWRHLDMEFLQDADLQRFWEKCLQENSVSFFISELNKAHSKIIFTWGFPLRCINIVKSFKNSGVDVWWFHGNERAAKDATLKRDGRTDHFDIQMEEIRDNQ